MRILFGLLLLMFLCGCEEEAPTNIRTCGTQENLMRELSLDNTLQAKMIANEQAIQTTLAGTIAPLNDTIPVVVHVIYNTAAENISDARILEQIAILNRDFSRKNSDTLSTPNDFKSVAGASGIKFILANRDQNGNPTSGIERRYTTRTYWTANGAFKLYNQGGLAAWDCNKYLNVWVINLSGSLGYATYPGGNPIADGVAIKSSVFGIGTNTPVQYNKGRTLTHEVGHWLNLYHTWGDAFCGDDKISDTPTQERSNYGCPLFPHVTCNNGPKGDMFMNYMDYSNDACMNMFTKGQVSRVEATLKTSRAAILNSPGYQ